MAKNPNHETLGAGKTMISNDWAHPEGMPRWVKVFGIIGIILAVIFVLLHLTGHGLHGHMPSSNHPPATDTQ